MATSTTSVDRDYIDNFSIKEFTENTIMPKYFNEATTNLRTIGMIGMTTEQISNIGEDAFNTGSVLFREGFPNRAQIPESIYSHAAIFQLSNVFSSSSACKFLIVLDESAILKNMLDDYDKDSGIYSFYLDKNTLIYVEDKVYTIDYDVRLSIVKKITEKGEDYLFTAKYIMDEYKSAVSDIVDPYVKIRRSADGYLALEVSCHQCIRDIREETITSNSTINYPVIDVDFTGKLAGFDILYKAPTDTGYIQMGTQIIFSQPVTTPFCYYQMLDDDTVRISFNSKDNYFMPEFNSELKIILYITDGGDGNFDVYNGKNISLVPNNEKYSYANTYLTAAKPIGSSQNGQDQMSIDALQSLAVEGYRTALALTTDNDLAEYFSNYKYRYGDADVLFIKKRDDVYERVFSGFLILKNSDYVYHTNTLNLKLNLSDMKNPEKNIYMLEPGYLFTSNDNDGYAHFYRDETKERLYYQDYLTAIKDGTIPYIEDTVDPDEIPAYLNRPASFAEYKARHGLDDKLTVFDLTEEEMRLLDSPSEMKFLLINPFLIRFKKNPNLVSIYLTYISNASLVDFTNQNDDSYVQFIMYMLHMDRDFDQKKDYHVYTTMAPSISINSSYPVIDVNRDEKGNIINYKTGDKYNVVNNDLRVIMLIKDDDGRNICFSELYPSEFDNETNNFTFSGDLFTDDHITSDSKLRILSGTIFRNKDTKEYYKVHDDDATLYDKYDSNDNIIATDIAVDEITRMVREGSLVKWSNVVNMTSYDDILVPMTDVTCSIYTLYRRIYSEADSDLVLATTDQTNNMFAQYDKSLEGYIWTNEYTTVSEPMIFMKPLDSVRTYLTFEDYTEASKGIDSNTGEEITVFSHDIMDVEMYSISFIRWSLGLDKENLAYFMNSFYAQYNFLVDIINTRLRNVTNIDVKFYNTYGRSKNFIIGEDNEVLDTVNLSLAFDVWFINGTDMITAKPEVKRFIKSQVESINSDGINNLFISNLMRKIELNFAYVDHIRFQSINKYGTDYQAVKNYVSDLTELTVEERRFYVPEMLVCDIDDITINDYYVS